MWHSPRRKWLAAISVHWNYGTHCHFCSTRYSFTTESSEACEGKVPCPKTQHRNNIPILREEKHYISMTILLQVGCKTTRQAMTLTKRLALTIKPCASVWDIFVIWLFVSFSVSFYSLRTWEWHLVTAFTKWRKVYGTICHSIQTHGSHFTDGACWVIMWRLSSVNYAAKRWRERGWILCRLFLFFCLFCHTLSTLRDAELATFPSSQLTDTTATVGVNW